MTIFLMLLFPLSNRTKFTPQFSLSQQVKGGDPSPLFKYLWCMCLKYYAMFWSPQLKGDRYTGESPQEGHKDDEGIGAVLLWGKAQRAGAVQPKSPQGDLSTHKYPQRWCSEDRARLVRGSKAISTNWNTEVSIEHQETHFYSEGDWAPVEVAQELCDLPPLWSPSFTVLGNSL